jgi:hypothetical protein
VDGQVWSGVLGEQHQEEAIGSEKRKADRECGMDDDGERRGAESSLGGQAAAGK